MRLTDLCPYCMGAKCRSCNNTGLRMHSHGKPPAKLMIEDLKRRRVDLWKIHNNLPDDDENKEKVADAARAIYDKLQELKKKRY